MPTHSSPLGVTTLYLWPTSCLAMSSPLSCVRVSSARAVRQQAMPAAAAASNVLTIGSSILAPGASNRPPTEATLFLLALRIVEDHLVVATAMGGKYAAEGGDD